jgi:hypothetical protein
MRRKGYPLVGPAHPRYNFEERDLIRRNAGYGGDRETIVGQPQHPDYLLTAEIASDK